MIMAGDIVAVIFARTMGVAGQGHIAEVVTGATVGAGPVTASVARPPR